MGDGCSTCMPRQEQVIAQAVCSHPHILQQPKCLQCQQLQSLLHPYCQHPVHRHTHPAPAAAAAITPGMHCRLLLQQRESFLKSEPMANRGQTYAAIRKLLSGLDDPFTRFLEPSRLAALRRGTAGQAGSCC